MYISSDWNDDEISDMESEANRNNRPSSDIVLDYDEEFDGANRRYLSHAYVDLARDTLRVDAMDLSAFFKDTSQLKLGLIHLPHTYRVLSRCVWGCFSNLELYCLSPQYQDFDNFSQWLAGLWCLGI